MHFDLDEPVALAGFAAPAGSVEREEARAVAADGGFGQRGEPFADQIPGADVRRRRRARTAATGIRITRRLANLSQALDASPERREVATALVA